MITNDTMETTLEAVEVGTEDKTVIIELTCTMKKYADDSSFDYNVDIDDVGQITLTPRNPKTSFISVVKSGEPKVDNSEEDTKTFDIKLTAHMVSENTDFDYFVGTDDVGQAVVTPYDEKASFLSAVEDNSLNLVTEEKETSVDMDGPYTKEQIRNDLKVLTQNFTIPEDTLKAGYKEEIDYSIEILEDEGYTCDVSENGDWYEITFKKNLTEDYNPVPSITLELCDIAINDLEKLLTKAVQKLDKIETYFDELNIHFEDIHPYFTAYLLSFINDKQYANSDVSCEELRHRLFEYEQEHQSQE